MTIHNTEDLRLAYILLKAAEARLPRVNDADRLYLHIKQLKWDIREYTGKPAREERLVRDYGMDGGIILFPLPSGIQTMDEAKEYFMAHEYIAPRYSAYDCTGRPFTGWYKIFRRQGTFWAYHRIEYDV